MMLHFITGNLSSIVVGAIVTALVAAAMLKMHNDKKKGKSSCGCNCADCPGKDMCHTK